MFLVTGLEKFYFLGGNDLNVFLKMGGDWHEMS